MSVRVRQTWIIEASRAGSSTWLSLLWNDSAVKGRREGYFTFHTFKDALSSNYKDTKKSNITSRQEKQGSSPTDMRWILEEHKRTAFETQSSSNKSAALLSWQAALMIRKVISSLQSKGVDFQDKTLRKLHQRMLLRTLYLTRLEKSGEITLKINIWCNSAQGLLKHVTSMKHVETTSATPIVCSSSLSTSLNHLTKPSSTGFKKSFVPSAFKVLNKDSCGYVVKAPFFPKVVQIVFGYMCNTDCFLLSLISAIRLQHIVLHSIELFHHLLCIKFIFYQ